MELGLVGSGSGQYVEFALPYLTSYKPFIAVYDVSGVRIVEGGNVVRAQVVGSDYAVVKGYFVNAKPYIVDVSISGDGARFLPALFNQLISRASQGNGGDALLYILEFRIPNDVGVSVKFHKEVRRCFFKYGHAWVGREVCFDVDRWREAISKYGGNYFIRIYPVHMSVNDALRIVDSIINSIRGRINYLSEDLKYELRAYRRARLKNLINELNEVLRGWEGFRASLVRGNAVVRERW